MKPTKTCVKNLTSIIAVSSVGALIEWYNFFILGNDDAKQQARENIKELKQKDYGRLTIAK